MKQIRREVFETNSSSTHAICITKNDTLDTKVSKVHFSQDDYGWERSVLDTVSEKASYLYTAIVYSDLLHLIDKVKVVLDNNGINYEFTHPNEDYYIDHVSELKDFLEDICNDSQKLMRYLFSSESFILTGNDNSYEDEPTVEITVSYDHDYYYKGN